MQSQLRDVLVKNAVRVVDLFRDWDENGDGTVDKREFRKAMAALGVDAPRAEVDRLFDSFDPDGSGCVEYNEMNAALKRRVALDPSLQAGAMGKIETKALNKIRSAPRTCSATIRAAAGL